MRRAARSAASPPRPPGPPRPDPGAQCRVGDDRRGARRRPRGAAGPARLPAAGAPLPLGGRGLLLQAAELRQDAAGANAARDRVLPRLLPPPGEGEPPQALRRLRKPDADVPRRGAEKQPVRERLRVGGLRETRRRRGAVDVQRAGLHLRLVGAVQSGLPGGLPQRRRQGSVSARLPPQLRGQDARRGRR